MKIYISRNRNLAVIENISSFSKDSGHGDGMSEISDDAHSGNFSPLPMEEKKKLQGLK